MDPHTFMMKRWDTVLSIGCANLDDVRIAFGLALHMSMDAFGVLRSSWGVELRGGRYRIDDPVWTLGALREFAMNARTPRRSLHESSLQESVLAACEHLEAAIALRSLEQEP